MPTKKSRTKAPKRKASPAAAKKTKKKTKPVAAKAKAKATAKVKPKAKAKPKPPAKPKPKAKPRAKPPAKKPATRSAGDLALQLAKTELGSGTAGVDTKDFPDRALLSVLGTKYALLVRDRDAVIVSLLLPEAHRGADATSRGFEEDPARRGWARIRLGNAPEEWTASGVADLAAKTIAALRSGGAPAPAPPPPPDPFRSVADTLVAALVDARGDAAREETALRDAIAAYAAIASDGDPDRTGVTHYLAEEGSAASPPALERVPGGTEADTFRWREKLADLCGY